ncbi:hypothetical protein NC652_032395 [Populus alba x Populus x berolinensis]|nr:hypothetical protein NC652_032395 [Populus alba x Populus x berolinensis]
MLRHCCRNRSYLRLPLPRSFSSCKNPIEPPNNLKSSQYILHKPPILHQNHLINSTATSTASSLSRNSVLALSATLVSAVLASLAYNNLKSTNPDPNGSNDYNPLYAAIEQKISKSNESLRRIFYHARKTGVAASVLWQSLSSVLSSANHEVRVGFELRVAALLADIAAANAARRAALVEAGGGAVVDWLLETIAAGGDGSGSQAEAARALAYLIADPNVSADVLGRPHAVPYLLRFIFSCQPKKKRRSMLVAAIMDIVTSNCESSEKVSFKPSLPGNAEMRDIAAAIEVVEEGGLQMDNGGENEDDDDGGRGMKGIGIKILEGTTVLGLSRTSGLVELENSDAGHVESFSHTPKTVALLHKHDRLLAKENLSSAVVPGLWDDLQCQHVAVPFAAWALANWAMASEINRYHIQELDRDGQAVMTALMAPERSVKWHGSLVAQLLLKDRNLPLNDSVSDWSSSLLATISQASKNDDIPLAQMALSAFLLSVERSPDARKIVMEKGLQLMRDTAKKTTKHKQVQEALAKALELLSTGDVHLSLEDSQKWSGILLLWVFAKISSSATRSSAIKILSCIFEEHGTIYPYNFSRLTQIDQSNILFATQTANQLAGAVVNLARNQLGTDIDSFDTFPLADLLSMEPFIGPLKNIKKDAPKSKAADSALATLKGIKALTELCAKDSLCQEKNI